MEPVQRYYRLEGKRTASAVVRRLAALGLTSTPGSQVRRVYLDSFDWGALRKGHAIFHETGGHGARLEIHSLTNGRPPLSAPLSQPPRLASDASPPGFRNRLASLVGIRRLFPVVDLLCERRRFRFLDKNGKTVCWVTLERCRARKEGAGEYEPLPERVALVPVRGYPAAAARVAALLEHEPGLVPTQQSLLEEALQELQISTSSGRPNRLPHLDAGTTSAEAVRGVFADQLGVMETNREGVCEDYDPEFLHEFRIAVRKTRTLLGQLKALPAEARGYVWEDFGWLSRYTGPVRDLAVYILGFGELQASLPDDMRDDLLPFLEVLERKKREHHEELVRVLRSERYQTLIGRWRRLIDEIGGSQEEVWQQPIGDLAGARIRKLYRRVLREGDGLDEGSEDERYHQLRKTCKKLRYLTEFFEGYFDGAATRHLIRSLKRLQRRLGRHQDCSTQLATFRRYGEQMQASGEYSAATIMALGVLIERLKENKLRQKHAFRRCFESFASGSTRTAIGRLSSDGGAIASESPRQL